MRRKKKLNKIEESNGVQEMYVVVYPDWQYLNRIKKCTYTFCLAAKIKYEQHTNKLSY